MRAALLTVLLLLLAPVAAQAQGAISLINRPLVFNPDDKSQTTVGRLRWRGGAELTSPTASFGGLSDLELAADGRSLIAITDAGRWLTAELTYDAAGDLRGLAAARMGSLHDLKGRLLSGKWYQDAEGLARLPDGSLLVAFEGDHRLSRYAGGELDGPSAPFPAPPGLRGANPNAGLEALVTLADGRLLAFIEGPQGDGSFPVYLREASGGWRLLSLKPSGLFRPTGAALLPSGDVLLLQRRFTLLGGLGSRLSVIPLADIRPGATLESQELAELRSPLAVDNFEGVAVHLAPDGSTRITLISDDNFNPLQRTLIVQFELLGK